MNASAQEVPTPLRRDKHSTEGATVADAAPVALRRDDAPSEDQGHTDAAPNAADEQKAQAPTRR